MTVNSDGVVRSRHCGENRGSDHLEHFEKIKATLPPEYIDYLSRIDKSLEVKSKPYQQHGKLHEIIEMVSEAAVHRKYIEISYYTMSRKQESRRRVAPYKIWFFEGRFYLIGNCGLRQDGSIIFEAEVAGTEEIKYWVLKWGAKAVVMAPESLRDEIRAEATAMLQMTENVVGE